LGSNTFRSLFLSLVCCSVITIQAQDKALDWKFPMPEQQGVEDKTSGLVFYTLEQNVHAAFKRVKGVTGAVVVMPGPRLSSDERKHHATRGVDPDRMLTAMAVAMVLPMSGGTNDFFVAKEDWNGQPVYRWKTKNGVEACASPIPLEPYSDEQDVLFVAPCTLRPSRGTIVVSENGETPIRGYEDYIPRTIREIIRTHSDPQILGKNNGSMMLTGDTYSSRIKVTYTGSTRPISSAKKAHLDLLVTSFGADQSVINQYQTEMLFLEGTEEHWLPVRGQLIPFFQREVNKGDKITIYAEWVGAKKIDNRWQWIFMVHEFSK
jgi:hypothetical protein